MKIVQNITFAAIAASLAACSPQGATDSATTPLAAQTPAAAPANPPAVPTATAPPNTTPPVRSEAQPPSTSPSVHGADEVNLLGSAEGGQLLAAPNDNWKNATTGSDADVGEVQANANDPAANAVYAFKNERPATFKSFSILIPSMGDTNPGEIELLVSNDSPTGTFRSLGRFKVLNAKMMKTPYQEFTFPETTAKYLKVRFLSNTGYPAGKIYLHQIRLMGKLVQ